MLQEAAGDSVGGKCQAEKYRNCNCPNRKCKLRAVYSETDQKYAWLTPAGQRLNKENQVFGECQQAKLSGTATVVGRTVWNLLVFMVHRPGSPT
jgi:hypothetical protein